MFNMSCMPASANCEKIAEAKEHVLVGVSPFNSYYSEEMITKLIKFGMTFKNFHLFVPDTLPYFNFLAKGYSHNEAKNKAKRQWNYLRNKIIRAFAFVNYGSQSQVDLKIITIGDTLRKNEVYNNLHQSCLDKYKHDTLFKANCVDATKAIFSKELAEPTYEELDISVRYLLAELPLYLNTPKILGVSSSLFVYHDKIDFFVNLYNTRDNELLANNQGHLIVKL